MDLVCRVCLIFKKQLINVYAKAAVNGKFEGISEMIMACTAVKIDAEDSLPKHICHTCLSNLLLAFDFKKLCEKSNDLLLEQLNKNKVLVLPEEESEEKEYNEYDFAFHGSDINDVAAILNENSAENLCNVELNDNKHEAIDEASAEDNSNEENNKDDATSGISKLSDILEKIIGGAKEAHCIEPLSSADFQLSVENSKINRRKRRTPKEIRQSYECEICHKVLNSFPGLEFHLRVHNGIKPYKCTFENCTWSFFLKSGLRKHMLRHTGECTFLCSICGKSYLTSDSLRKHHNTTHVEERPYKCQFCPRNYTLSSHLKKHILGAHSLYRPHVCDICGRGFVTNYLMKKHIDKYCGRGITPIIRRTKLELIEIKKQSIEQETAEENCGI